MRHILQVPLNINEINNQGYTIIDLLDFKGVQKLNQIYNDLHPDNIIPDKIDGIHMTTWCRNRQYKLKVKNRLESFFAPYITKYFDRVQRVNHVFIVKEPGETTFKVHQDWNVVDESQFYALNVWIPLHDVNEDNGAMWLLPGSQNIDRKIRGSGYLFPNYAPHFDLLEKNAKNIPLKAGQAVVFNVSMIHGSPANHSAENRKSAVFTVFHEEADMNIYFQKSEDDELELHKPHPDFMYQYDSLRTDTIEKGPTENPELLGVSYKNEPIQLDELTPFFNC